MNWLKWIKTAANIGSGGMSSLYLYGGLFVAGAAAFAGAALWHGAQVEDVRFKAFKAGNDEVQAEWDSSENERLREAQRELTRMVGVVQKLNGAYSARIKENANLADQLHADGLRLDKAERDAAIAAGTADANREYASTAADHYGACRKEYIELGQGYADCSAAAQSLSEFAEAVSNRPSRPTPPTPPAKP